MTNFLKLHADDGSPVLVAPWCIESVHRRDRRGGGSVLYLTGRSGPVYVEEEVAEIERLLLEGTRREVPPTKMPSHGVPR